MALISYFDYLFREMALPGRGAGIGTRSSHSIDFDKDDHIFLSQFDSKWWPQAIYQRKQMLHDALMKLQKIRDDIAGVERTTSTDDMGQKSLRVIIKRGGLTDKIVKFLQTGDASDLTEEEESFVRKRHTFANGKQAIPITIGSQAFWDPKGRAVVTEKDINEFAEDDAFEIAKKQTDNPEDALDAFQNRKVNFEFSRQGRGGALKIPAFAYLNRLYHKLEKTRGEFHHPRSGVFDPKALKELESEDHPKGEYGFDLSHPGVDETGKKYTRGLDWHGEITWKRAMTGYPRSTGEPRKTTKPEGEMVGGFKAGYLAHSAYNHYGDLTQLPAYKAALRRKEEGEGEGVVWLPMNGEEGRLKIEDPKIDWIILAVEKIVKRECLDEAHEKGTKCTKNSKQIKKEAKARVAAMVCKGEIEAHPIPGPVPSQYEAAAKNRKYELDDASKSICTGPVDQETINKIIKSIEDGKAYIKEQYVFLPFESIEGKFKPILPKSSTLKKPTKGEEIEGEEEDDKKRKPLTSSEKDEIIKNADKFTQTSIVQKDDPRTLETGERTDIISTGPTPSKQAVAYVNYKLPSEYHKREFLDKLITPKSQGGFVEDEWKPVGTNPDFLKGIIAVLKNAGLSGGADAETRKRLLDNELESLHTSVYNFVVEKMLGSIRLLEPNGRRNLAASYISSWLQGAVHDMAPRRQRRKIGAVTSLSKGEEDFDPEQKEKESLKYADQKQSREYLQKAIYELEKIEDMPTSKPELGDSEQETKQKLNNIFAKEYEAGKKEKDVIDGLIVYVSKKFDIPGEEAKKQINSWKLQGLDVKEMYEKIEAGTLKPIQAAPLPRARAKMAGGPSPLLKKPTQTLQSPTKPGIAQQPPEQQVDWNSLVGLTISERVNYFKNKLKN